MKKSKKYGIIRVINRWLDLLPQIFKRWRLFLNYAAVFTILSAVLNRWTYSCHGDLTGYWCYWYAGSFALSLGATVLFYIAAFYLLASFSDDFYKSLRQTDAISFKDIFSISSSRVKSCGIFLLFWGLLACSTGLFAYILNKPANPDWRIEFIWFILVFSCFVTALLIMRCFGAMSWYFNEQHLPFSKIYELTRDRAYVGIFSFLILVMMCSSINLSVMRYFDKLVENHNYLWAAIVSDFGDSMAKLFYLALFIMLSQAEYFQMKEKENELKEAEETATLPEISEEIVEADTAENAPKTKKSAKKKKTQRKNKNLSTKKNSKPEKENE